MNKILKILLITLTIILIVACGKKTNENTITKVLVPKTPSGIPVYLAVKDNPQYEVEFFLNHSQANAKFLRGDAQLLLTGVSVANSFAKQDLDFDVVCSVVDNLTFLVGNRAITDIELIKGETIIFPFADSPMEQLFTAIAKSYKLEAGKDYQVKYLPVTSSVELLKQGSDELVFLPEPFVTVATTKLGLKLGLSLNNYYQHVFKDAHASQVLLLSRDISKDKTSALSKEIESNILKLQQGQLDLDVLTSYPNIMKFSLDTFRRTSYHYSQNKELQSNLDILHKNISKENNLAKHILELD
jgi:hypothetical protein